MSLPALLGALALSGAAGAGDQAVDYRFAPHLGADGLDRIEITLSFRGDADGDSEIELPDRWAGSQDLHRNIRNLAVTGGTLAAAESPSRRHISHPPGANLVVTYEIGLSGADPDTDYAKAVPVVRPGWFFIHGEGAIVVPAGRHAAPARFRWGRAPARWRLGSNLDRAIGPMTVDDAAQSIFVGGRDYRLVERRVGGRPLQLMLRGTWPFRDEVLADHLARVVAAQNDYMARPAIPFFVAAAPLQGGDSGAISINGTGRSGGFALAATTNADLDRLVPLLAHEYGHRWFGRELGPIPEPNAPEFWFSEGFNDFASSQALVRSGSRDAPAFVEQLNETLLRYASSPARRRDNAEIAAHFWEDDANGQMPYDRGRLFAISLNRDGAIERALRRMAAHPEAFPAAETEGARLVRAAAVPPEALAAMLGGTPIALPADALAPCGTIEWAEQPIYAPGYSSELRDGVRYFTAVTPDSPAWRAGLRPGMRYVRRISFRSGDAGVPIVMRVGDAEGEREISWLPAGAERVRFQRLVLAPDAGAACTARLGGR